MDTFTREERNAVILRRNSVFDLREQTADDLAAALLKLAARSGSEISIVEQDETNLIGWFVIESGANLYEVRRFETFCFCSCPAYFYGQKACVHIAITFPPVCTKCGEREAEKHGEMCGSCEIKHSPYFQKMLAVERKPEKIGNIRF